MMKVGARALLATSLAAAVASATSETRTLDMVVTSHPLATAAGEKILQQGGSAADAMVAVQSVLGLVEPQFSGLGGGAFAVYYDATTKKITTFDGREKAPAAATEDRFSAFTNFFGAWQSGLSVGVPGVPRMLEAMHVKYGKLPWGEALFADARELALNGFEMSEALSGSASFLLDFNAMFGYNCSNTKLFWRDPTAMEYLINSTSCAAKPPGTILLNPEYADTLDKLASGGSDAFYSGSIAEAIVDAVGSDPSGFSGDMTLKDLAAYNAVEREPVCTAYKTDKKLCGMGPPSSGGLAVGQMLTIMDVLNVTSPSPLDVETIHAFTQAGRLAFADRNRYVADPDFVDVPSKGMLDHDYLKQRANLVDQFDMGEASPGIPPMESANEKGDDNRAKNTGTSHISIVDRCGNALSMTTSVEAPFGNGIMTKGFFLNNELTDFSFAPSDENGNPVANRVEGNKRPRSSMAPTIVLGFNDRPELLTGSPGGSMIIGFTAQSIFSLYDFGLDPQTVVNLPHYQNRNEPDTYVEAAVPGVTPDDYNSTQVVQGLEARNHSITLSSLAVSGLAMILVEAENDQPMLVGGADQRRSVTVGGTDASDDDSGAIGCSSEGDGTLAPSATPTVATDTEETPSSTGSKLSYGGLGVMVLLARLLV